MAGINLSGAIGQTGKRASVLSDLPNIIQHTGDFIAKARLDAQEQKAKLAAAQKEKDLEDSYKNMDDINQFMSTKSDLDPKLSGTYYDAAKKKINDYYKIEQDPSVPKSVKDQKKYETKGEISKLYRRYENDEKVAEYLAEHEKDPTMDISGAQRFLSGTEGVYEKTTPILENEQTAPYKINVPIKEAQVSEQTTTEGLRPDYYKLSAEERLKIAPEGLNKEVHSRIALKNTTPEKVAEDVLGGDFFKAAVKTKDVNGNISYQLDPNAKQVGERDYVYNVMNQTTTSAETLYKAKKAMAISVLRERNKNINPMSEEFDNLANEMVEKSLREDYGKIFESKTGAIMDKIAIRTKDKDGYGNEDNVVELQPKENQERITLSDWTQLPLAKDIQKRIDDIGITLSGLKDEGKDGSKEYKDLESRKQKLEKSKDDIRLANTYTIAARPTIVALSNTDTKFKDSNNNPIDGTMVSPIITNDGKLMIEIQDKFKEYGEEKVVTRIVPLNPTNESILLQSAGDNKGRAAQQIAAAKVAAAKQKGIYEKSLGVKSKEKSVPSQPKEAPKKQQPKKETIIEGKTIPAGGVPKYSKTTGKLIGYELNGEKYKF
jgi:hypothetical protein